MASIIKLKRSFTGGSVPAHGSLKEGELAVNITDKKLYVGTQYGANVVLISGDQYNFLSAVSSNTAHKTNFADLWLTVDNKLLSNDVVTFVGDDIITVTRNSSNGNIELTIDNDVIQTFKDDNGNDATGADHNVQLRGTANQIHTIASGNTVTWSLPANVTVNNNIVVLGNTHIHDSLFVHDETIANNNVTMNRNLSVAGNTAITTNITVGGTASVTGASTFANTILARGNVTFDENLTVSGNTALQDRLDVTGNTALTGSLTVTGASIFNDPVTINDTTTISANVAMQANVAIGGNLVVSGNTHIDGNLSVEGAVTYISSSTVNVDDSMIKLSANNSGDTVDVGVYGMYKQANTGLTPRYAGWFRDATDGNFKFYANTTVEPTTTVNVSGTGYKLAQVDAIIDGGTY
jgi:cytoskeletal protein CcmA (bactofilin family)